MNWASFPAWIPHWLRRHPLILAAVLSVINYLQQRARQSPRTIWLIAAISVPGGILVSSLISNSNTALAMQSVLNYGSFVVAASGLYSMSAVSRLIRKAEAARAQSWLAAALRVNDRSASTIAPFIALALLWRYAVTIASARLLSLNSEVSAPQSLRLVTLITIGGVLGSLSAWALSRRARKRLHEGSRYVPRTKHAAQTIPSNAALSHWPIAQAFAWSRPENTRLLLGIALISLPAGMGALGAISVLVTWIIGSYLIALLVAVPCAARSASDWLRSTSIGFWAFAWPLARRALLHQFCGTLTAMGIMLLLGASLPTAVYLGTLWLALAVTAIAISLADCYRSRFRTAKTALSIATALAAEERAQGWGISLALLLTVWHLRIGALNDGS